MQKIYLDHNATTPVHLEVLEVMLPVMREFFGNPSSIHSEGRKARVFLDEAREQVADLIGASPGEIIFTSGGTESNNLASAYPRCDNYGVTVNFFFASVDSNGYLSNPLTGHRIFSLL